MFERSFTIAGNPNWDWPFISPSEAFMVSDILIAANQSMPQSQRKLVHNHGAPPVRHGKHRLDQLDAARVAKHLVMFQPSEQVVKSLVAKARISIPGIAETIEALKVLHHNPDWMLAFARKSKFDPADPVGEGFIFALPLNTLGLQNLALGTFNAAKLDLRLLTTPSERPAGLYLWGVFAPGPLAACMALLMEKLSASRYAGLHIYARPATADGRRFSEVLGFTQGTKVGTIEAPDVWIFSRKTELPSYDTYVPGQPAGKMAITVARSFEDLTRVIAIRSAVYIGEQECPYDEEYDGNDLAATHLIAYAGDEPAGCLRVRFFADFAKLERLAVRKEFRKSRAAFLLVNAGLKLCQKKGYRRAYGHSQTRLVNFWGRFGFRTFEGAKSFVFSDFDYVELAADLEPDADAVRIGSDPYTIIRPEGRWHTPGILERSASRAPTSPSVDKKP
jgi:predicted GNAT family N-acyltransferase